MTDWRRTLYTIWFTQFIAIAGFNFVVPFIPYYVQTLGISDLGQVALWAGMCTSGTALGLAVMAPIWGVLADRYGRKLMILRATFAGAGIMALMGFVFSVQQLLLLRVLQGVFTGTITASTTLVASIVPADRRGAVLGSLQTAVFLGNCLGPLLGGVMGETFGYRQSFWVTGGLLLLSGIVVVLFVHEDFRPAPTIARQPAGYGQAWSFLLASGGILLAVLTARILMRAGTVVISPVLALLVQTLLPDGAHAGLVTGLLSGATAVGGAVGAPVIGGWGDRWGHRPLLIASGLLAALFYLPQAFAPTAAWLVAWQLLCGFAVGGTLSTLSALLAQNVPPGREGMVFGLDASATGLANAIGPLLGAAAAAVWTLRAPFVLAAVVLLAGTLVVAARIHLPGPSAAVPPAMAQPAPGPARTSGPPPVAR